MSPLDEPVPTPDPSSGGPDEKVARLLHELVGYPVESLQERRRRISQLDFQDDYRRWRAWLAQNHELRELHEVAVEDYVAARHAILVLGLLRTGLALAAQSVEKLLKCCLLCSDQPPEWVHDVPVLLNETMAAFPELDLHRFEPFSEKVVPWYGARYADAASKADRWERAEVNDLDQIVCYLEENLPIPEPVEHLKFGGGEGGLEWPSVFVRLFVWEFSQSTSAILNENTYLEGRVGEFEHRFRSARMHAIMPGLTRDEARQRTTGIERGTAGTH